MQQLPKNRLLNTNPSILGVGIAVLDMIQEVDGYPDEDSEVRALSREIKRGGNCANTLMVLTQLGNNCAWAGIRAADREGRDILQSFAEDGINTDLSQISPTGKTPLSHILLNRRNGSRSIVHYRDLAELSCAAFKNFPLETFNWVHFEGRNISETACMIKDLKWRYPKLPVSLEVEKAREGIETLFAFPDVLLFSKHYARQQGYTRGDDFLTEIHSRHPQKRLFCAWGEEGAYALDLRGGSCHSPAFPPPRVVDTLGAGDTFNAGVIHALLRRRDISEAIQEACRLAGEKCGRRGLREVRKYVLQNAI